MKTPPPTLAGMRAIIQYLVDWDNDSGYYYLPTLLRSPILAAYPRRAAPKASYERPSLPLIQGTR
jgi:hypothetical protein